MIVSLSSLEKKILDRIQSDFPVCDDPYREIAQGAGCTRAEALHTVASLRRNGVIRRIGGIFSAAGLGYESCLAAARVDADRMEDAASRAGAHPGVTHCYERGGAYNLWFTIVARDRAKLERILDDVRACDGVHEVHELPALKTFKIKVDFAFTGEQNGS
jgi:DNA-binding Lrp family transcriptional regulator